VLLARREVLSQALDTLAPLTMRDTAVRLRLGLTDGSVVEGFLISASREHLSLRMVPDQARYFPAEQIRSLHVAVPRRGREWALASVGIVGATAAVIGLTSLPAVGVYLRTHIQRAFGVVFYLGIGLLVILLAKTGLHDWLTRWDPLVDLPGDQIDP
jgi:hypothetical protein